MLRNHSLSWKCYVVQIEYTYGVLLHLNPIVVLIGSMNTRRNAVQIFEENVANAGVHPHDDQIPPLDENANVDQDLIDPSSMKEEEMRVVIYQMAQAFT